MTDRPLKLFQVLQYKDGEIIAVQSPPVTKGAMRVRFLHQELRTALLDESQIWPPTEELLGHLCQKYRPYLTAIAAYLQPSPDLDRMEPLEQFYWFIATQPEQIDGKPYVGLSHIEKLIGIQRKIVTETSGEGGTDTDDADEGYVEGTGDVMLDLISDAHLVFKSSARHLLSEFSPGACMRMLAYAGRRKAQAMERMKADMDGKGKPTTRAIATPDGGAKSPELSPQVKESLGRRGIALPD